jgi:hypothetical protein
VRTARKTLFFRSNRQDRPAVGALVSATHFSVHSLYAANYFGARQHRHKTIIADGGRIFLGKDFEERFHNTHTIYSSEHQRAVSWLVALRRPAGEIRSLL